MIPDIGSQLNWLEHQTDNLEVPGSSPGGPTVLVAQVIRALVCGTKGRGFESLLAPYIRVLAAIIMRFNFNDGVVGSSLTPGSDKTYICPDSSVGRARKQQRNSDFKHSNKKKMEIQILEKKRLMQ